MHKLTIAILSLWTCLACSNQSREKFPLSEWSTDRLVIANEMLNNLNDGLMASWYPRCIDNEYGGYLSGFDQDWNLLESQDKFIVMQGRHTWATAQMAMLYPEKTEYEKYSKHGFEYLKDVMWDKEFGGFYTLTSREREVLTSEPSSSVKITYGNVFGIYGLAAYYELSGDSAALKLAIDAFHWLDHHAHDSIYGGYFQFLSMEGNPYTNGYNNTPPKDQNSSIHILEALTELYGVWKNEHLKARLIEMLHLIRDTITTDKGSMNLFFRKDWSPVFYTDKEFPTSPNKHLYDHVSFGHDIETAFLLIEASEAAGLKHDLKTHEIAKRMADHSIKNGWRPESGAMADAGYYYEDNELTVINDKTGWWVATESFNTMLIMSELYPEDPMDYYDKFTITWNYCKKYLIDWDRGGWYSHGTNLQAHSKEADKGGIWTGNYHTARSLIQCSNILKGAQH